MQEIWSQNYDPAGNVWVSALVALIPIIFFFLALTKLRMKGYIAGTITVALALAVALLFYRTLASYRLYIIAMTGAAAFLVSRVAAKLSRSNALALGAFGLALAAAPIFNEGMYSYYAVPQRTLLWAAASWLCLFYLHESHHHAWGVAAAVLAFIACHGQA